MKWVLIVVALLIFSPVAAQTPEPVTPIDPGNGWSVIATETASDPFAPWQEATFYGGPDGARVTIWHADLGHGIGWVGSSWTALETFWTDLAMQEAGVESPATQRLDHFGGGESLPVIVTDRLCVNSADGSPVVVGVCLYGSYTLRSGVVVLVEGTVNGLTGVAATDYVAGLYFAALSA